MDARKLKNLSCALALGAIGFGHQAASAAPAASAAAAAPAAKAAPAASASAKQGPGDPVAVIRKKDAELQKLLREKNAKTDRIKALINGIFDFEELGKRALGNERWATMPADQQKRFVKAFKEMVETSSVKKLEAYHSDSTTYEPANIREGSGPKGPTATVTSHVFSKGQESIVTYKLLVKDGEWKAWDLVIDDLSTAGNYGDQFRKILQNSDMEGLIARLEKKAAGTAEAKPADSVKSKSEKAAKKSEAAPAAPGAEGGAAAQPAAPPEPTAKAIKTPAPPANASAAAAKAPAPNASAPAAKSTGPKAPAAQAPAPATAKP
jgi:phospholipid transport system substrate-binding protein